MNKLTMKKVTQLSKANRAAVGLSVAQCSNLQYLRDVLFDVRELITAQQFTALQELSARDQLIRYSINAPRGTLLEAVDVSFTKSGYAVITALIGLGYWPAALPTPDAAQPSAKTNVKEPKANLNVKVRELKAKPVGKVAVLDSLTEYGFHNKNEKQRRAFFVKDFQSSIEEYSAIVKVKVTTPESALRRKLAQISLRHVKAQVALVASGALESALVADQIKERAAYIKLLGASAKTDADKKALADRQAYQLKEQARLAALIAAEKQYDVKGTALPA